MLNHVEPSNSPRVCQTLYPSASVAKAIDSGSRIPKALLEELVVQPDGDHEHVGLAVQLSAGMLSAEGQQKGPTKLWRSPALGR